MGRRRGKGQISVLALIGLTQESQAGAVIGARQTLGLAVCLTVPITMRIVQLCGAMMVVSGPIRLRIMGVAVGVLTMRMSDTVHGVISMSVII